MATKSALALYLVALMAGCILVETPGNAAGGEKVQGSLLQEAIQAEAGLELTRAATLYDEILRHCGPAGASDLALAAQQGLRRVASLRVGFAWTQADLDQALAKAFSGYRSEELSQWEGRGWLYARDVDRQKRYHVSDATNLAFFDTTLRRRNPRLAEGDRLFAKVFLEAAAELDVRRRAAARRSLICCRKRTCIRSRPCCTRRTCRRAMWCGHGFPPRWKPQRRRTSASLMCGPPRPFASGPTCNPLSASSIWKCRVRKQTT